MNWLLLRGLSREQRHWGDFPKTLAEASGDRVHCLDLPGFGTERGRPSPTSISGIVEDLRERWLPLSKEFEGEWGLLGQSLGGMVTMQWAHEHPTDFARVVLVNTSARNLNRPWQRMQLSFLPSLVRSLLDTDDEVRERRILRNTTRIAPNVDEIAKEWASYMDDGRPRRTAVLRQLVAATRYRTPDKLAMPVLVVAGAKDPLAAPVCARTLAGHFKAALEMHPEGGHELAVDAGGWMADVVARWAHPERRRVTG